jgi:hypothetical protein
MHAGQASTVKRCRKKMARFVKRENKDQFFETESARFTGLQDVEITTCSEKVDRFEKILRSGYMCIFCRVERKN